MDLQLTWADWRLPAALVAIFLGGFAKGVAGLGVPIVSTPFLALLFDLKSAILVMSLPTVLSDVPFVVGSRREYRHAAQVLPYIAFGFIGILFGARLLISLDPTFQAAVLGTVITVFVVTAWLNILPTLDERAARYVGAPLGLLAGFLQSSSGASGPLTAMYLLSLHLPRAAFLFVINAIFLALDSTQFFTFLSLGYLSPPLLTASVISILPMAVGFAAGRAARKHVDDRLFRRFVLVILLIAALNLFAKVVSSL